MSVMRTERAFQAPMPAPAPKPTITRSQAKRSAGGRYHSVVSTAIAIPAMPKRLPWRAVAGEDSPRSASMKRMPETR